MYLWALTLPQRREVPLLLGPVSGTRQRRRKWRHNQAKERGKDSLGRENSTGKGWQAGNSKMRDERGEWRVDRGWTTVGPSGQTEDFGYDILVNKGTLKLGIKLMLWSGMYFREIIVFEGSITIPLRVNLQEKLAHDIHYLSFFAYSRFLEGSEVSIDSPCTWRNIIIL